MGFEWDEHKNEANLEKHGISFDEAQFAFNDPKRVITVDGKHSTSSEKRYFCFGKLRGRVVTVRFTKRNENIRIYGAGYWREGNAKYKKKNKL